MKKHPRLWIAGATFAASFGVLTAPAWAADTYTYDAQGRLLTVTYDDGSSITYTYDATGNRTVLSQTSAPG